MKPIFSILIVIYFLFGIFCLPNGNFAALTDLPAMYTHCKAYEDKDMTTLDFLTDHLINIDGIFDKHESGDDQKPHVPFNFANDLQQIVYTNYSPVDIVSPDPVQFEQPISFYNNKSHSGFVHPVFKPPIA